MFYETNYLIHYNMNHDKLGRFAKSGTGSTRRLMSRISKKIDKKKSISDKDAVKYLNKIERRKASELMSTISARSFVEQVEHKDNLKHLVDFGEEIFKNMSKDNDIYHTPKSRLRFDMGRNIVLTILGAWAPRIVVPSNYYTLTGRHYKSGKHDPRKYKKVTSVK